VVDSPALRVAGALVGTLPGSVLAAVCLARFLPFSEATRATAGLLLAVPLWTAAMTVAFLARSAAGAWGSCVFATAIFAALAYGVPP
jgi:hypothetical protein